MVKVSVLYPNEPGHTFDMGYYFDKHLTLVEGLLGSACKGIGVDVGIGGPAPGSEPAFVAMAHLLFDSVDDFQKAFAANADAITSDISNYTNIEPTIVISEVKQ